jgi:hypothetical protein
MKKAEVLAAVAARVTLRHAGLPEAYVWCDLCERSYDGKDGERAVRSHVKWHHTHAAADPGAFWHKTFHIHGMVIVPGAQSHVRADQMFAALAGRMGLGLDGVGWTHVRVAASYLTNFAPRIRRAGTFVSKVQPYERVPFRLMPLEDFRYLVDLFKSGMTLEEIHAVYRVAEKTNAAQEAA